MEKDKLDKAALDAFITSAFPDGDNADMQKFVTGIFKQGAEWLMGQPLSERLSEDERENVRAMYMDLIPLKGNMPGVVGQMMLLEKNLRQRTI